MMLVIRTQYMENYGAHDWDGSGECPQYWKCKGGSEYKVKNIDVNRATDIANWASGQVERDTDYCREYVIDWSVEADDYLSSFEKDQMEYDGKITFHEPVLDINQVAA